MSRKLSLLTSYSAGLSKEFEILIEIFFENGVVNKAVCLFSLGFVGKHVPTNLT